METSPHLHETAAATMPTFPVRTPHRGIRPAPARPPALRCVRASLADQPARRIPIRAPLAATPVPRESRQTSLPAPRAPFPARAHSRLAAPARTSSAAAAIPAACRIRGLLGWSVTCLWLLQLFPQMKRNFAGRRRHMHEAAVCLTPRRWMSQLDFPHTFQDRLPKISEHGKRFLGHHRLVQHFPNHRELHKRPRAASACYKAIRKPDQLEQSFFPALLPHLHVNPRIDLRRFEEFCRHPVSFSARLFRAPRYRFHHAAITAAANGEAVFRAGPPQHARLFVSRVSFMRARTTKHRDNQFFPHLGFSILLAVFMLRPALRRRHIK